MKLFGWMQTKLSGKQGNTTIKKSSTIAPSSHSKSQECREEFSDWPHGLLAIGTFGIKDTTTTTTNDDEDIQQVVDEVCDKDPMSFLDDFQDFDPEEIEKLQKELNNLLTHKSNSKKEKEVVADFPLDRFLNCPSSLEIDRRLGTEVTDSHSGSSVGQHNVDKEEDDIERTISVILDKCKDIRAKKKENKTIRKKSISFLLKKMFVCSSGFAPQPSLNDTFGESRMEKLLRTLMHKRMSPQNGASSVNKCINHKQQGENEGQNRQKTKDDHEYCSKWVKTDSQFIVLEI